MYKLTTKYLHILKMSIVMGMGICISGCHDEPAEEEFGSLIVGNYTPILVFDRSQTIVSIPAEGGEATVQYAEAAPWPILSSQRDLKFPMETVDYKGRTSYYYSVQLNTVDFSPKESLNYDNTSGGLISKEIVAKAKAAGTREIGRIYFPKNEDEKKYPVRWSEDWAQMKCSLGEIVIKATPNTTGKDRKIIVLFSYTMGAPYNNHLTVIQTAK